MRPYKYARAASPFPAGRNANFVNAARALVQSVSGAFTIVKTTLGESLGIIKKRKFCLYKIKTLFKEIFTEKHFGAIIKGFVKTIKEIIFIILLIIFTLI